MSKLTRRDFLRASVVTTVGIAAASCAQPTAQIVEKEVPVQQIVKETVVVEKQVAVEKVVTATAVVSKYGESPIWAGLVAQGKLPPVDERLPEEPLVITPAEEVGQYGGTWHRLVTSAGDANVYRNRLAYENPVRWNIEGTEVIPNICKSWEISPDGLQFTFNLRKGIKWSDGEPYTTADWGFLLVDHWGNKERQPSYPSFMAPGGVPVEFEAIDDFTARFTFAVPNGLLMVQLPSPNGNNFSFYPAHYLKQFHVHYTDKAKVEAMAKAAGFEFWYQYYADRTAPLSNPEMPAIFAWYPTVLPPKQPIVLERNPYYWKVDTAGNQLPYIDRIENMLVADGEQINLRAASGEVDMQMRQITMLNYPIFQESAEIGDYRVLLWPQGLCSDTTLHWNTLAKDPVLAEILSDKRFRYAMSLGTNRDEIIQAVWLGMSEPSQLAPLPTSSHYWEEGAKFLIEYDPDRANAYLDEMGLTERDSEGYRLRKDGKRLSVVYTYATTTFGDWRATGELLTEHWKPLGVELLMNEMARPLWGTTVAAGEHELTVWVGSGEFNPLIDPRHFFPYATGSSYMAPAYSDWYQSGGTEGTEPPADSDFHKSMDLFDQIKVTVDSDEQHRLFRQILEIAKDNLWTLGIGTSPPQPVIVKNNFRNVPEWAIADWNLLSPGSTVCEQYFIRS